MQTWKTNRRPFLLLAASAGAALPLLSTITVSLTHARPALAAPQGQTPAALAGTWGFTTISGTTYWDKSTGAYRGSGSGGSQSYTFARNGTYKLFNYVKSRSYGWEIQTLTWEEGKATFEGDTVKLRPTAGKYQVMDSSVKKNNYTRPMRPDEIKKNARTFHWSLESKDGKPCLMLGKDAGSLTAYQKQK